MKEQLYSRIAAWSQRLALSKIIQPANLQQRFKEQHHVKVMSDGGQDHSWSLVLPQLPLQQDSVVQKQQMFCQASTLLSLVQVHSGTLNSLRILLAPQMDDDPLNAVA